MPRTGAIMYTQEVLFLNLTSCVEPLTDLEELRVHAVKVGDEEAGEGAGGVEKQQVTSCEIQDETAAVDHHETDQLHRQDHPNKNNRRFTFYYCYR